MADYDPRLVQLYDTDNPDLSDHDFYRSLADRLQARTILDVGCGTGILTVTFATHDRTVVGVDPSATMLDYAKVRPGSERVTWVHGVAGDIDRADVAAGSVDYAVMTGNVAQHLIGESWPSTLRAVRRATRDGAVLAFESRNPGARAYETWGATPRATRETHLGPLTEWTRVVDVGADGAVLLAFHTIVERTGEQVVEELTLAFRDLPTIERDLACAGFALDSVYGDWAGRSFTDGDPIMVFHAVAAAAEATVHA